MDGENNRGTSKRGGCVGAYIHNSLNFTCVTLLHLNTSQKFIESLWFEINREPAKNLVICVIYRPPNGDTSAFCERLTEH